ncbi:MAG: methyltransferase [Defluviitaleaceae bacterium]|nr:methyltransferase [Defluviitaleaceae bacterium]MCL2262217.1 methyltransferase [Defluviitaleaceae bacterium]
MKPAHYFIENPDVLTREREISIEIFGTHLRFFTNNGLFSCDKIDDASLTLVQNMPQISGTVLDLGCGYGFIGIALACKNKIILTQSDINSLALGYAEKNSRLNNVPATQIHSDSFEKISTTFDTITLNPPIHAGKSTMYRMYEESANFLNENGSLFVVIQKKHGAESTIKKLNQIFTTCITLHKKRGCYVLHCVK